ncbi:tetratricopeptide repeat protein [Pelomicrobium sp.]|jgi:TPR repeat protein|uniref:tetratricopeptide repeat protein n=1 Tax=Pelomicrobium sp. TaxID=2815319 RepID=UPI002FDD48C3
MGAKALFFAAGFVIAAPAWAAFEDAWRAYLDGDYAAAERGFAAQAQQGDARAAWLLGELYARGRGVAPDSARALEWKERAAVLGDEAAQFAVGEMYAQGRGAPLDPQRAAHWYERAAQQGHPNAALALARLKEQVGDMAQALSWYRRAAEAGLLEAQERLAKIYEEGLGVARDPGQAAEWRRRAEGILQEERRFQAAERARREAEARADAYRRIWQDYWGTHLWLGRHHGPWHPGGSYGIGFGLYPWGYPFGW